MRQKSKGFTLIELLIVVAIIAILALIAVPNFLEAQVRSKASRVKNDLRSLATAVEAYFTDHNDYPLHCLIEQVGTGEYDPYFPGWPAGTYNEYHFSIKYSITTPIAYVTRVFEDPFFSIRAPVYYGVPSSPIANNPHPWRRTYLYTNIRHMSTSDMPKTLLAYGAWRMWSGGPDLDRRDIYLRTPYTEAMRIYDATNGTVSRGDIWRTHKSPDGSRPYIRGLVE